MKLDLSFWKNASLIRKRVYLVIFIFLVATLVTFIASAMPITPQEAYALTNEVNQTLQQNLAQNTLVQGIFVNNFVICLIMFIPLGGLALGMQILFNTGVGYAGIAYVKGYPVSLALANSVTTPVFWLEFAAYSIAMAESIWLFRRILQASNAKEFGAWSRMLGHELKWTAIFVGTCAGSLALGAVVEAWLITVLGG